MKIQTIYDTYSIMPNLQEHMYKVASVASIIIEKIEIENDKNSIITACLLHDMGNIIKFKLDLFPEFLKPKGLGYWSAIKNDFIERYGEDEHKATEKIAREIGVNENVLRIIDAYGFSKGTETKMSGDINLKIATYSDMRVSPHGIENLATRIEGALNRKREHLGHSYDEAFYDSKKKEWEEIEQDIFSYCTIIPQDINDKSISPFIENLRKFEIEIV